MRQALDRAIHAALPGTHERTELDRFHSLIRDYPMRGGKRLRGLLTLLAAGAHGSDWHRAVDTAAALELFQNWVLIHDDIEDDSLMRRDRPALHRIAGMPIALNVGDALHAYMWRLVWRAAHPLPKGRELVDEFLTLVHRTAEGQHLELSWIDQDRWDVSESDYLAMVTLKTAYYTVVAPLRLGARLAGLEPDPRFESAGTKLGVAFQVRDDVLNLLPGTDYGKEFAGDLLEAKRTLILTHALRHAAEAERAELVGRLRKPRGEKTDDDVQFVLDSIARHQSLDYAQRIAEEHAQAGLELLEQALVGLSGRVCAGELMRLVETLASRSQ